MSIPSEESIYKLIPRVLGPAPKPPRYKSKFYDVVKTETRQNKAASKTMGPAKVPVKPPQDYLKRSKEPKLPEKKAFQYPDQSSRRPAVPPHTERPQMGAKSSKNFITTNAVTNVMSVPRKPAPKYVDTAGGSRHELEKSGLVPKYVNKKDYGQVPPYLEQRKQEMEEAQAMYDHYIKESLQRGQVQQVAEEERLVLLEGLKKNWEELHHQYQGLSVVTDTAPKKARKERMEAEMKQLEKDIELIERHQAIYISQPQHLH